MLILIEDTVGRKYLQQELKFVNAFIQGRSPPLLKIRSTDFLKRSVFHIDLYGSEPAMLVTEKEDMDEDELEQCPKGWSYFQKESDDAALGG